MEKNERSFRDLWTITRPNVCVTEVAEEEKKEDKAEKVFKEIMA